MWNTEAMDLFVLLKIYLNVSYKALFHVLESEQLKQGPRRPSVEKQLRSFQLPSFLYGSDEVSPQHVNVPLQINCNYILSTKFPWPGDSERSFSFLESSYHLPNAHPSTTDGGGFTLFFIIAEGQAVTL